MPRGRGCMLNPPVERPYKPAPGETELLIGKPVCGTVAGDDYGGREGTRRLITAEQGPGFLWDPGRPLEPRAPECAAWRCVLFRRLPAHLLDVSRSPSGSRSPLPG